MKNILIFSQTQVTHYSSFSHKKPLRFIARRNTERKRKRRERERKKDMIAKEWEVLIAHLAAVGFHKSSLAIRQEIRGTLSSFERLPFSPSLLFLCFLLLSFEDLMSPFSHLYSLQSSLEVESNLTSKLNVLILLNFHFLYFLIECYA